MRFMLGVTMTRPVLGSATRARRRRSRERVGDQGWPLLSTLSMTFSKVADDSLGPPSGGVAVFRGHNRPAFFGQGSLDFRPPDIDAKV